MHKPFVNFDMASGVFDLEGALLDEELRRLILCCIDAQKLAAEVTSSAFSAHPEALARVSEENLQAILARGEDIHGIAIERNISNVISFNAEHIIDGILDERVEILRRQVDRRMGQLVKGFFGGQSDLSITCSGHMWYPPGAYMGWHTNSKVPGWRVYINFAEEAGNSFFRYRDPDSGKIITLLDGHWNIRIFRVTKESPLWHAVYSDTNRFSFGYLVFKRSLKSRILGKLKRMMQRRRTIVLRTV